MMCGEKMLTLENVLEIESQELSINRSALLLNVQPCVLSKFINDNKIFWRGKGIAFAKSVGNGIRQSTSKKLIRGADQASVKQLALAYANNNKSVNVAKVARDYAIPRTTLVKRLKRMTLDQALISPKDKGHKRKVTNAKIVECEKLGLSINRSAALLGVDYKTLYRRIKKLGINWRGQGKQIGGSK